MIVRHQLPHLDHFLAISIGEMAFFLPLLRDLVNCR